ncbi:hypothetical protein WJX72_001544 [[Myrmecia] bisecta]|uniref:Uncharacterized protein n=1 Tax=[Myrmecia] bisecta TaxID=41462 RepID=A0AAW1PFQ7_9CHLO
MSLEPVSRMQKLGRQAVPLSQNFSLRLSKGLEKVDPCNAPIGAVPAQVERHYGDEPENDPALAARVESEKAEEKRRARQEKQEVYRNQMHQRITGIAKQQISTHHDADAKKQAEAARKDRLRRFNEEVELRNLHREEELTDEAGGSPMGSVADTPRSRSAASAAVGPALRESGRAQQPLIMRHTVTPWRPAMQEQHKEGCQSPACGGVMGGESSVMSVERGDQAGASPPTDAGAKPRRANVSKGRGKQLRRPRECVQQQVDRSRTNDARTAALLAKVEEMKVTLPPLSPANADALASLTATLAQAAAPVPGTPTVQPGLVPSATPAPLGQPLPVAPTIPSGPLPPQTRCVINISGGTNGVLQDANITCTGPAAPVPFLGSADLGAFASKWTGATFTPSLTLVDSFLQLANVANVQIDQSSLTNVPGSLLITKSIVHITSSNFTLSQGSGAGALDIASQSLVTINSCQFRNNSGPAGGAISISDASTVIIASSGFANNANDASQGGALAITGGSVVNISSTYFLGNTAQRGGAIYMSSSSLAIKDSNFTNNVAQSTGGAIFQSDKGQGGGLYQSNCTGNITETRYSNNSALNGGGLYQNLGRGAIIGCSFDNNRANQAGGALLQNAANFDIISSNFTLNAAGTAGGAAYQNAAGSSISNSFFVSNSAGLGGAVYRNTCRGEITSCSFRTNVARAGGAIYENNSGNNIAQTEFTDNSADQGSTLYLNASVPRITGSLFNKSTVAGDAIFRNNVDSAAPATGGGASGGTTTTSTDGSGPPAAPGSSGQMVETGP